MHRKSLAMLAKAESSICVDCLRERERKREKERLTDGLRDRQKIQGLT